MSLSQFGYTSSYSTPGSPLSTTQLLPPAPSSTSSSPVMSGCCENGRSFVHPHTGQTVCSCQYSPSSLLTYSRVGVGVGVGIPDPVYPATPYSAPQGYVPLGPDPSAFYPPLNSPYELKEAGETWRGIGQTTACYPYDPTSMPPYPYPNAYGTVDINSAARRKNATRENTNTLKAWLYEHRKNPYPTKGEKIMLAIITKMTLTQVSTWFANARRRLKKENKMTWSPRNKPGEQDDDDDDDDNSKEKTENANNSDDDSENGKTNREEQHSTDRDPSRPSEITEPSTSATSMHAGRMYDPGPEPPHPPHSHLQGPAHSSDLSMPRRPQSFGNPHMASSGTPPSFLNMPAPSQVQGYSGPSSGAVTSQNGAMVPPHMEGPASGSLKRPDSLCSNSNDSGLSDVNCTYSEQTLDGLRPKIWSLAHVATSEPGYMNHAVTPSGNSSSSSSNSNVNNSLSRNLSSHPRGLIGGPMPTGGMGQGHMPPSMLAGSMGLTDNTHLSSVPPPPSSSTPSSMPPLSGHMSHQWGSIFGSHGLGGAPLGGAGGGAGGKSPCGPGPLFPPQSIPPGMGPGMPNGPPNTMATLHSSSPSPSAYNQNMSSPASYYPNQKMTMD